MIVLKVCCFGERLLAVSYLSGCLSIYVCAGKSEATYDRRGIYFEYSGLIFSFFVVYDSALIVVHGFYQLPTRMFASHHISDELVL